MSKNIIYKMASTDERSQALVFLMKRYVESGYFADSDMKKYSDNYVGSSIYFVAKEKNEVVGVIRLVRNSEAGIPVLNEYELTESAEEFMQKNIKHIFEIGNLAALPGRNIAKGLYRIAIRHAMYERKKFLVAGVDSGVYRSLMRKYPITRLLFKQIAEPKYYLGSETVPIIFKLRLSILLSLI